MALKLDIVSPEKMIMSSEVSQVTVPGADGYFTVMGDHAPLMTTLKSGFLTVNDGSSDTTFYVAGGFADACPVGRVAAEVGIGR